MRAGNSLYVKRFFALSFVGFVACNGAVLAVAENKPDAGPDAGEQPVDPNSGFHPMLPPDATTTCCPIDPTPGCCMNFGGTNKGFCGQICDGIPGPGDPEWKVVKNADGCDVWTNPYTYAQSLDPQHDPRLCGSAKPPGCEACATDEICVMDQTIEFGAHLPDANGKCEAGRHLAGTNCVLDLAYSCQKLPTACTATVDCACAETLCTSQSSCQFTCKSASTAQVQCQCALP